MISVIARNCNKTLGLSPTADGVCVCADQSALDVGGLSCVPLYAISASVGVAVLVSLAAALAWRRWGHRKTEHDQLQCEAAALRERLLLTQSYGFFLRYICLFSIAANCVVFAILHF